ncbi:protein DpdJ [Sphingopyxis granuli]|uniref:protein DpdJ n=1 Tax=Sphingopyxis granuli TaxID=267128 RepID=UPI0014700212|nr:protein DpdJ [Sphingopyxis granuli]
MAVLDAVEQMEARLLSWGLVDSHVAPAELHGIIDEFLDDPVVGRNVSYLGAGEVIAALIARALILNVGDDNEARYRSRMAEAVRLSFRLRQLFPKHAGPILWQTAPTLVADFRFLWRRRSYPKRDKLAADAVRVVNEATDNKAVRGALAALVSSYGSDFALADFQVKATARILAGFNGRSSGTLVSAGTGSGKTLAFYLPALARVAAHIETDPATVRWVKVLALYPRNELLKDQFAEVYSQARRLDASLSAKGRRKILIGTFFGPTPHSAVFAHNTKTGWQQISGGLRCDFIRCPTEHCLGDMVWLDADRAEKRERLCCLTCDATIESDEVILTRERLVRESPDILFTTTEMLNQRIGDGRYRHLFGVGDRAARPAELMLLDEVHTYAGTSGAQVAYLIRRWRWLLRRPVSFVGLSATLKDGARFFARLTGLSEAACAEVTPSRADMISEGAEYMLALRGDPVSRTALLSTSIQTAMLLSRILDDPASRRSEGVVGERLFLFTDDIDVTNRMYFAMLDAEGRDRRGAPDMRRKPTGGLATLRFPSTVESRKLDGQDWDAVTRIGHTLQQQDRKSVGRVMSMDPGVGNNLDIIVATAALEVGFNDPRVGAVIQHKAPRDVAQFLQRKGRAGRLRRMRPWTVAILSDYGRDRIAYQGYDLLFDPELPVRSLPTTNRYIQRIQAVYATLDYLAAADTTNRHSVWHDLAKPSDRATDRNRQTQLAQTLRRIIVQPAEQDRYAEFLAKSLRLKIEDVQLLLWEQPRPLLTEVLPTAVRRLETNWRWSGEVGGDYWLNNAPLPEFAPANLFTSLNLPEVQITLPPSPGSAEPENMVMPIGQALREFSPGRVSRRFGLRHERERHWIAPELDAMREQAVSVGDFASGEVLGRWPIESGGGVAEVQVLRPRSFRVSLPPSNVLDSSNSRLRWRNQLIARTHGLAFAPPAGNGWSDHVRSMEFFTHQGHCPIETRRVALGSDANILFQDGTSAVKEFYFESGGERVGLGFTIAVDALCMRLALPDRIWENLDGRVDELARAMRTAYFYHQARHGPLLDGIDNIFARDWLAQLLLTTLTNEAVAKSIDLRQAAANLAGGSADLDLDQTLNFLFQSQIVDDASAQGNAQDRLRQDLAAYLANPDVVRNLLALGHGLYEPLGEESEGWLRERFTATIAAALIHAIESLCPEVDTDELVVDIHAGPRDGEDISQDQASELWISEMSPGGNGHIEEIQRVYAEDPRRFYALMSSALRDNDFALSDFQLKRFVNDAVLAAPEDPFAEALQAMRRASGAEATHRAFTALRHLIAEQGYVTSHAFMVALSNRVLRPGSSAESDRFLRDALLLWDGEEARLGVELDARVIAYRLSRNSDLDQALGAAGIDTPTINPDQWRFSVIYGLLWPRGSYIRQAGLALYSTFSDLPAPETLLVRAFLPEGTATIDLDNPTWRERCLDQLARTGAATLVCALAQSDRMAEALTFLATNPVEADYLSVFARTQAIRRVGGNLEADIDIAEALQ